MSYLCRPEFLLEVERIAHQIKENGFINVR